MDMYDINAYSSEDDEPRRPKIIRHRPNLLEEYDAKDFFVRFRLSPRTFEEVLEEVEEIIAHSTNRNDCLSAQQQLLLALNFYSNGSFLRTTGDYLGVSKSTASLVVRKVSRALATLRSTYIQMPNEDDVVDVKQKFYNIARFPRCIGALDCTHIKILSPGGDNAEVFRNRKQFFSLNVQTVADPDLKIRDIVGRWPGSAHDSNIFQNSRLYGSFEMGNFGDGLLLGDSGYPIKPYLITPLQQVNTRAEALFNESHIRTRNVVERQYGVWKRRFPALAMGLRVKIDTVQVIIVATAVLHNIACTKNEEDPPINEEQEAAIDFINNIEGDNIPDIRRGVNNRTRNELVNNFFNNIH